MEDIIAYSIIAILLLVTVVGAVLLRRRFVRSREAKVTELKQQQEQSENQPKYYRRYYQKTDEELLEEARATEAEQRQARLERERIKGMQNVTPSYPNLGNAGAQRYDTKTGTIQTAVYDNTTNSTKWAAPGGGATTAAQPVSNSTSDLITGMAIGSLVSNLFNTSHAKSSTDDSGSTKSSWSNSSSSDSSSSWGSSDDGPSSDW